MTLQTTYLIADDPYGFQLFVRPYNKFTKKMVSNDQDGIIEGFDVFDDLIDGSAEWLWCFNDNSNLDEVMKQLDLLNIKFVVQDLDGDNAYNFGE